MTGWKAGGSVGRYRVIPGPTVESDKRRRAGAGSAQGLVLEGGDDALCIASAKCYEGGLYNTDDVWLSGT